MEKSRDITVSSTTTGNLVQNNLALEIAQKLAKVQPDWNVLLPKIKEEKERRDGTDTIPGHTAEQIYSHALRKLSSEYPNRLVTDPIVSGVCTSSFYFQINKVNQTIVKSKDKNPNTYCEYDIVMVCDNLPVLIESKLVRNSICLDKDPVLQTRNIEKRALPLYEYFQTDKYGYIVIAYPEAIYISGFLNQRRFIRQGGIFVPFYTTRDQYLREIQDIINSV